jgi:hypothetical protein
MLEFDDDQWREVFEELRIQVIGAGFGDWDRNAICALEEAAPRTAMSSYLDSFARFLKVGSTPYREELQTRLGMVLETGDGMPVTRAILRLEEDGSTRELLSGPSSDDAIAAIFQLSRALFEGGLDAGWDREDGPLQDDDDGPEGDLQ